MLSKYSKHLDPDEKYKVTNSLLTLFLEKGDTKYFEILSYFYDDSGDKAKYEQIIKNIDIKSLINMKLCPLKLAITCNSMLLLEHALKYYENPEGEYIELILQAIELAEKNQDKTYLNTLTEHLVFNSIRYNYLFANESIKKLCETYHNNIDLQIILNKAIESDSLESVQYLSSMDYIDYFCADEKGESAIIIAIRNNNAEFLEEMIPKCNPKIPSHRQ